MPDARGREANDGNRLKYVRQRRPVGYPFRYRAICGTIRPRAWHDLATKPIARSGEHAGMSVTLRQIEVIRAILITGTIAGAAKLLNVSAPGVSRLMKYTEHAMKV
eukprot:gene24711-26595_t